MIPTKPPDDPTTRPPTPRRGGARRTRTLKDGRTITVNDNDGIRKRCGCPRRNWATCKHSWFFSFKWQDTHHRFPVDKQAGKHIADRKDAKHLADTWRCEIREGRFVSFKDKHTRPVAPSTPADLTFVRFAEKWRTSARDEVSARQQASDLGIIKRLTALLGDQPIGLLTVDVWESAFKSVRKQLAVSTANKYRQCVLSMQEWAVEKAYLPKPWLEGKVLKRKGTIRRQQEARRYRRLVPDVVDANGQVIEPGEESRLLAVSNAWLQRLIIGALESACRLGELLSLQWRDVSLHRRLLLVRAVEEGAQKTGQAREVPISDRLYAVLKLVQHDPAGNAHPPHAYVFGNPPGEKVGTPKKAWLTAVLRAHGHQPQWTAKGGLTAECRAHLATIDLEFRDLRREAASRMLERNWPLQHVSRVLGHADVKTTSIYLSVTIRQLQESMRRFGTGATTITADAESGDGLHDLAQLALTDLPPSGNDASQAPVKPTVN